MLNREILLCAAEMPEMGWIVAVQAVSGGFLRPIGATDEGKIQSFGGAPELASIYTSASLGSTQIMLIDNETLIETGTVYRKDKDVKKVLAPGDQYWILFSEEDSGKEITVYYIPA